MNNHIIENSEFTCINKKPLMEWLNVCLSWCNGVNSR